jgi:hypothetical protein
MSDPDDTNSDTNTLDTDPDRLIPDTYGDPERVYAPLAVSPIAQVIQEGMISKIRNLTDGHGNRTFRNLFDVPMETIQPTDLPALAVFIVEEEMHAVGGRSMAEMRFNHDLTIGLQAVLVSSDAEDQRAQILACLGRLDQFIFTDQQVHMLDTNTPDSFLSNIQSIFRIVRRFKFRRVSELPIVQLHEMFVISYESVWPPWVPDDYLQIGVTLAWPIGGDLSSLANTPINVVWDILQTVPQPPPDPE